MYTHIPCEVLHTGRSGGLLLPSTFIKAFTQRFLQRRVTHFMWLDGYSPGGENKTLPLRQKVALGGVATAAENTYFSVDPQLADQCFRYVTP